MIDLRSRHSLFWILQTSGWALYLGFILLTYWARGNLTADVFRESASAIAASFLVTLFLRLLYRKIKIQDHSVLALSARVFVLTFLGGNVIIWISTLLEHLIFRMQSHGVDLTFKNYLAVFVSWTIPLIGWSALYFGIKFWQEWMIQKDKADKAEALAQTAQLQLLRYRMNPHFLFNTLNSIRALISEDKTSAKSMITELSEYLRYSLVSKNYENVPLKDEMESVRHYFVIQKMRYENKLDVSFDVDSDGRGISHRQLSPPSPGGKRRKIWNEHEPAASQDPDQGRTSIREFFRLTSSIPASWVEPSDHKGETRHRQGIGQRAPAPGGGLSRETSF